MTMDTRTYRRIGTCIDVSFNIFVLIKRKMVSTLITDVHTYADPDFDAEGTA